MKKTIYVKTIILIIIGIIIKSNSAYAADRYPDTYTFTGGGTYCLNSTVTLTLDLSFCTTGGGGVTDHTFTVEWYNSSGLIAGETVNGTTTAGNQIFTYNPPTSSTGSENYYVIITWENSGKAQCGNNSPSTSQTQTVIIEGPTPSQPVEIFGQTTVNASTSGLVYSIDAIPGATSYTWSAPGWTIDVDNGTDIEVTSGVSGTDISVTANNICGSSSAQTLTVSISTTNNDPVISVPGSQSICDGNTLTLGNPPSITDNDGDTQGITITITNGTLDLVDGAMTVSGDASNSIIITNNAEATLANISLAFNGAIFTPSITSGTATIQIDTDDGKGGTDSKSFDITVKGDFAAPAITGSTTVAPLASTLAYSVPVVPGALTYTWTLPAGWTLDIDNGDNILVTSGNEGQNGDIQVDITYECGATPTNSVLAVTVSSVTDHTGITCATCHTLHNATGDVLTNIANGDLCMSCHNSTPGAQAENKPFAPSDRAISGNSGTSHAWNVPAINTGKETGTPTNTEMAARMDGGNIICSTCHDQHHGSGNIGGAYLRIDNTGDVMCKDCHSARNKGAYATDNVNNRGTHPVGVDYPPAVADNYTASPLNSFTAPDNKIECSSCHMLHYSTSTDNNLLRQETNDATLCSNCHINYSSHNGADCLVCHEMHNAPNKNNNIYLIRDTIEYTTPVVFANINNEVIFTAQTGTNSFADGDGTYDGICEVCHTTTSHFRNDGSAGDQNHSSSGGPQNGLNCTGCHPHDSNFSPSGGSCHSCHDSSSPFEYPLTSEGYNEGSHPVHVGTYEYTCNTCHSGYGSGGASEGGHPSGAKNIAFSGIAAGGTWNSGSATCNVYCHDPGNIGLADPTWGGSLAGDCSSCHGAALSMTATFIAPPTKSHPKHVDDYNYDCAYCHKGYDNTKTTHVDGTKNVLLDQSLSIVGGLASWDNPTCSSVYCHSDGDSPITYATTDPEWGGVVNCGECHTLTNPGTGAHDRHAKTYNGADTYYTYGYACSTCHTNATGHINGTLGGINAVGFNPNGLAYRNGGDYPTGTDTWGDLHYPSGPATYNGDNTCSNIYCHSNGRTAKRGSLNGLASDAGINAWSPRGPFSAAYATTPAWNGTLDRTAGVGKGCDACHPGPTQGGGSGPVIGIFESPFTITAATAVIHERPASDAHNSNNHSAWNGLWYNNDIFPISPATIINTDSWASKGSQCFACHNADANQISNTAEKLQGTYGTEWHADGKTWFNPYNYNTANPTTDPTIAVGDGYGTMGPGINESVEGSHCANSKQW